MRARVVLGLLAALLVSSALHVGPAEARTEIRPEVSGDLYPGVPRLPDPDPWVVQLIRYLRRFYHPYKPGLPEIPPVYRPVVAPHVQRGKLDWAPSEQPARREFGRWAR